MYAGNVDSWQSLIIDIDLWRTQLLSDPYTLQVNERIATTTHRLIVLIGQAEKKASTRAVRKVYIVITLLTCHVLLYSSVLMTHTL